MSRHVCICGCPSSGLWNASRPGHVDQRVRILHATPSRRYRWRFNALFYIYLAHPVNYQDCDGVGHNGMAYGAQNRVVDNIPLGAWRHAGNAAHGILPRLKHTLSTL